MKLKDFITSIPGFITKAVTKIGKWILDADMFVLGKAGFFVGIAAATIRLVTKFINDRKKAFTNEEDKTPVDEALDLGYNRTQSLDELHPKMSKVRKAAGKVFRTKKHGKKNTIWELSQKAKERQAKKKAASKYVNASYREYLRNYPYYGENDWDPCLDDTQTMYRIWNGTDGFW